MGRFADREKMRRAMTPSEREELQKRGQKWLEENREAMESSNNWVEEHGLPHAENRQF